MTYQNRAVVICHVSFTLAYFLTPTASYSYAVLPSHHTPPRCKKMTMTYGLDNSMLVTVWRKYTAGGRNANWS